MKGATFTVLFSRKMWVKGFTSFAIAATVAVWG
jgi:hypothetical protein